MTSGDDILSDFQKNYRVPPEFKALCEPCHEVLAQAVHESSESPAIRTVVATTLLTTVWQMVGERMSLRIPSLVFVPVGGPGHDPLDSLASKLIRSSRFEGPGVRKSGAFRGGSVDLAPTAMANCITKMANVSSYSPTQIIDRENHAARYFAAQQTGFGTGIHRPYSKAWHDEFGLLCDMGSHLLLRLDEDADRSEFLGDLMKRQDKLRNPMGMGVTLRPGPRGTAISGSLYLHSWTAETADAVVSLGLPLFVLPHDAQAAPGIRNLRAIELMIELLRAKRNGAVEPSAHLPSNEWFELYYAELERRLTCFPRDYVHAVNTAVRELHPVCDRIADFAGSQPRTPQSERRALGWDLYSHSLRGMVLSVVALSWHCLGFDPGCPINVARDLLDFLRKEGPKSLRDIQRKVSALNADQRDAVLKRLREEGLVTIDGKTVTATSFPDFVSSLHSDTRLPFPPNCWQVAREAK